MATLENQMNAAIKDVQDVFGKITPALPGVARIINNAINKNFAMGGRTNGDTGSAVTLFSGGSNKWVPLSKKTIKGYEKKGYSQEPTLYRTGALKSATEVKPSGDHSILITNNSPHAAIHQFGGEITIPPHQRTIKLKKERRAVIGVNGETSYSDKHQYRFATKKAKLGKVRGSKSGATVSEHQANFKERKIKVPARPFLTLTPEDLIEIKDYLTQFWRK